MSAPCGCAEARPSWPGVGGLADRRYQPCPEYPRVGGDRGTGRERPASRARAKEVITAAVRGGLARRTPTAAMGDGSRDANVMNDSPGESRSSYAAGSATAGPSVAASMPSAGSRNGWVTGGGASTGAAGCSPGSEKVGTSTDRSPMTLMIANATPVTVTRAGLRAV